MNDSIILRDYCEQLNRNKFENKIGMENIVDYQN